MKKIIQTAVLLSAAGVMFSCSPNADNAVKKLQEYGILDAAGSSSKGLSSDIMYHYNLFKDGNELISSYPYITNLARLSHEKQKKIPLPLLAEFLEAGADINALNREGKTALSTVVGFYPVDQELIDYLLGAGANPNIPGSEALIQCSQNPMFDITIVEKLVAKGADVNVKTGPNATPLLCTVARTGNFQFVEYLAKNGADINAKDVNGLTPLMAVMNMSELSEDADKIVDFLIKAGADVNAADSEGITPVLLAVKMDNLSHVEKLHAAGADLSISYQNVSLVDMCTSTAVKDYVTNAVRKQQVLKNSTQETKSTDDVMISYIDCGIFTKALNNPDSTHTGKSWRVQKVEGMDESTKAMRDDMFDHYESFKAGKETLAAYPYLPVMMHICEKYKLRPNAAEVKAFVDANADVNAKLPTGNKCLAGCYSIYNKWDDITRLLLETGMSPSGGDNDGVEHCLWGAVTTNNEEMAKLLISKGAKVDAYVNTDSGKYTLMGLFLSRSQPNEAALLCRLGANPNAIVTENGENFPVIFLTVSKKANVGCLSTLLENGGDPNAMMTGQGEQVPLIAAAINLSKSSRAVSELIKHKCDVNARISNEQVTPLMLAAMDGNEEIERLLINAGADKTIKSKSGETYQSVKEAIMRRRIMKGFINAASESDNPSDRAAAELLNSMMR